MSVVTQISVVSPPAPAPALPSVQLLPVADGRPAVTVVSWQRLAPDALR